MIWHIYMLWHGWNFISCCLDLTFIVIPVFFFIHARNLVTRTKTPGLCLWMNSVVKHQNMLAESTLQTKKIGSYRVLLHGTGLAPADNTPQAHSSSRMLESHIMFKTSGFSYSLFLVHIVAPIRSSCIAVLLSEAKVLITNAWQCPTTFFMLSYLVGPLRPCFNHKKLKNRFAKK